MKKQGIKIIISFIFYILALVIKFPAEWMKLTVFIISYLIIGFEILKKAIRNIFRGKVIDENFLMAIATIGAFAIGEYSEAVAVMLFYQVGELFQDYAVDKSRKSIATLMDIRPDYANIENNGNIEKVDPDDVKIGQIIIVKPGEKVPLDGIVVEGTSNLDTMALTGESVPRKVKENDEVLSGCINKDGLLKLKVTKEFGESTVSKVVSCPCALVISIPLSFFGGIGGASKLGILVKGSNYLEAISKAETVVFDKTGTLTEGVFEVQKIETKDISKDELLKIVAHAERYSTHPIAESIKKSYKWKRNKSNNRRKKCFSRK